jgi:hypothetical protein
MKKNITIKKQKLTNNSPKTLGCFSWSKTHPAILTENKIIISFNITSKIISISDN